MKELIQSKTFKIIAGLVGVLLIALLSFAGGVAVGLHKARFSYAFGQNYERNFVGPRMMNGRNGFWGGMMNGRNGFLGGMMGQFEGRDFRNGHGISGTIISISGSNLVVKDSNGNENNVVVGNQTIIRSGGSNLQLGELKQNDQVVVVGQPGDNGAIKAALIRVFPASNNQSNN